MQSISIIVTGKVQGVFFRQSTKQTADQLGLKGFVQNKKDGSVYIEACGDENKIHQLSTWCNRGPKQARVEKVIINEIPAKEYSGFEIQTTIDE